MWICLPESSHQKDMHQQTIKHAKKHRDAYPFFYSCWFMIMLGDMSIHPVTITIRQQSQLTTTYAFITCNLRFILIARFIGMRKINLPLWPFSVISLIYRDLFFCATIFRMLRIERQTKTAQEVTDQVNAISFHH